MFFIQNSYSFSVIYFRFQLHVKFIKKKNNFFYNYSNLKFLINDKTNSIIIIISIAYIYGSFDLYLQANCLQVE